MVKGDRSAYFFILPTYLLAIFILFKPLLEGIKLSFFEAGLTTQVFTGLDNYFRLFKDPFFWLQLKNTVIFVALLVPLTVIIPLSISLVIFRFNKPLQSFFRAAFYLPAVSAGVVMSMVWIWIFHPIFGLLNYLLSLVHLGSVPWLGQPNTARLAVVIVTLDWLIGMKIILYLAALAAIPKNIYEAASIDGANPWQKFWKITLPLVIPTTVFIVVVSTIGIFQIWESIFLLTAGGPAYSTMSIAYRIYRLGFLYFRFGEASAHAVVLLIIVFTASFLQFSYLNKKLEF